MWTRPLALLERHGAAAWVLAGGMDTFDWLKERTKRPSVVVDLSGIAALRGIRPYDGGLEIGAMTPLSEVVAHPTVRQQYGLLMEAADLVASPQIRNQGTLGGNVSRIRGAGITAGAGAATGRGATSATRTRRRR